MGLNADQLLGRVMQLNASVEALAALAAELRCRSESLEIEPNTRAALGAVCAALTGDIEAPVASLRAAAAAARAFLRQALLLADRPESPAGWTHADPLILESQGQGSAAMASVFSTIALQLPGLAAAFAIPRPRFLDVGTGVGRLALAMAERHAGLDVLGVDISEPALDLARRNVAASAFADRIEIRCQDVATLAEANAFHVAWIPGPFLPATVVPGALEAVCRALVPGGWLLFGDYEGADDPLSRGLTELRTIRSGGKSWPLDELTGLIARCGFESVMATTRTWNAPMRVLAGRKGT